MESIEKRLGHTFNDRSLLTKALTHSSYANENRGRGVESNERLEFLGDAVLGLCAADKLFRSLPGVPEGKMTRLRAQLVCEESLHRAAMELGIGEYIRLGRGEENTGGRLRASILADAMEAIIAAMYLDGGLETARRFIEEHILSGMDDAMERIADSKTELQELVQRRSGQHLCYVLLGEEGPDHDKTFTVQVALNGSPIGKGQGRSKKEAEQAAARAALRRLGS